MDDSKTITVSRAARSNKGLLTIRCKSGDLDIMANWLKYLGTKDPNVTMRVGDGKADSDNWGISTNRKGAFYRGKREV